MNPQDTKIAQFEAGELLSVDIGFYPWAGEHPKYASKATILVIQESKHWARYWQCLVGGCSELHYVWAIPYVPIFGRKPRTNMPYKGPHSIYTQLVGEHVVAAVTAPLPWYIFGRQQA